MKTWVCMVLMSISSGSYDGTVRLSCEEWDQVQKIKSLTFVEENVFDTGGMRVLAVRGNGCASSSTFVSSIFKFLTPSHWFSLPP